jgi:hypothetical protein
LLLFASFASRIIELVGHLLLRKMCYIVDS